MNANDRFKMTSERGRGCLANERNPVLAIKGVEKALKHPLPLKGGAASSQDLTSVIALKRSPLGAGGVWRTHESCHCRKALFFSDRRCWVLP